MYKRILAGVLVGIMLVYEVPMTVSAANASDVVVAPQIVVESTENAEETMEVVEEERSYATTSVESDFVVVNGVLTAYNGTAEIVIVPDSVTVIAGEAFYENSVIKEVILPDGVETIENHAFWRCINLESITFGTGLKTLETYAFMNCTSLTTIDLPDTLETISYSTFSGCSKLESIDLGESLTYIGSNAFQGCTALTEIVIPDTVESINSYAFYNCTGLQKIEFPNALTTLNENAFSGCAALTEAVLPGTVSGIDLVYGAYSNFTKVTVKEGITVVPDSVFTDNTVLTEVVLPNGVETVNAQAFMNCSNLASITFGTGLKTVMTFAFSNCTSLTTVELPDTVETLDYSAFSGCSNLESIDLGESLKSVGSNAFQGCAALTEIDLPNTVTAINSYAFYNCTGLQKIVVPDNLATVGTGAFERCSSLTTMEVATNRTLIDLMYENAKSIYKVIFKSGITEINNAVLLGNQYIKEVVVPEGVTYLGSQTFGDSVLEVVSLPGTLTEIGGMVFSGTNLKEVVIPTNVTAIGPEAFYDCDELTSVDLPAKLEILDGGSFGSCDALTEIEIPRRVESAYGAFSYCSNLKTVTLENRTTKIPDGLLAYCTGLESFEIPATVTSIGNYAFQGCTGLKEIVIPDSVTDVWDNAFLGCTGLTKVTLSNSMSIIHSGTFQNTGLQKVEIPESVTWIDSYSFKDCKELTEITIPSSVTEYGDAAFANCVKLESIELTGEELIPGEGEYYTLRTELFKGCTTLNAVMLGVGVDTIPKSAFEDCTGLTSIILPREVQTIEKDAFAYCTGLTEIYIPKSVTSIDIDAFYYADNVTIYGEEGSYAQTYAQENSIPFVVKQIPVEEIVLEDTEVDMSVYETYYLYADIYPEHYSDTEVTWTSSDESVVTIMEQGDDWAHINSLADGTATITVTADGVSAECVVNVTDPNIIRAESVTLSETEKTIDIRDMMFSLTATITPADCNVTPIWTSSNEEVAIISGVGIESATVTCQGVGTTDITVTVGACSATCRVTVVDNGIHATGVTLSESTYTMNIYDYYTLNATILPEDCTDMVHWESSDWNILSVDAGEDPADASVYAVAPGTAVITVYVGSYSASCTITVEDPNKPAIGVSLPIESHTMNLWEIYDIPATITPEDCTDTPIWTSSDDSVAIVYWGAESSIGQVQSTGVGTTTITVTVGEYSASCTITVVDPNKPATGVSLPIESHTMNLWELYDIPATITPEDCTDVVTWTSSDESVATVGYGDTSAVGRVNSVGVGTATITVTVGNYSASCIITVEDPNKPATGVSLSVDEHTMEIYSLYDLVATITPADCTDMVTWSSSDDSVARVYMGDTPSVGRVNSVGVGTATITVTVGNYSASCIITVEDPNKPATGVSLSIDEHTMEIYSLYDIVATITPADCTDMITWTSSDENVARVYMDTTPTLAHINSVGVGTATITVTVGNYSDSCTITVEDPYQDDTENSLKAFVERMYTVALGRDAEADGVEYWVDLLLTGKNDGEDIAKGFFTGEEFIGRNLNNEDYLEVLYATFFDREADEEGWNYNLGLLESNVSRDTVLDIFIGSSEFAVICENYGITAVFTQEEQVKSFVERMYTVALGREAEDEGVAHWVSLLLGGDSDAEDVAVGFFTGEEFLGRNLNNTEYLEVLYATFFDREPDAEGWAYNMGLLESNVDRSVVLNGFIVSGEFETLCNGYGIEAVYTNEELVRSFVDRMYTVALGRDAEEEGAAYWTAALVAGNTTGAEVADGFFSGEEFVNRGLSDREYVETLYATFFNREAAEADINYWIGSIAATNRRVGLIGFANSEEFKTLCNSYGIVAGEIK